MKKGWLVLVAIVMAAVSLGLPAGVAGAEVAQSTPVGTFPEWVNFYGINSTFNGAPLPIGSEVVAYSGSTRCGSFVVHTAGQYGLMPCYRNQADQPGAQPGDNIHFTVNGYEAILRGPDEAIWSVNGDRKNVELEAQGVPQTPTGTATQTTLPTSTSMPGTATPIPTATQIPMATPTATYPAPPPSPTPTFWVPPAPTSTPMPIATSAQVGHCRDIVVDGTFEVGTGWVIDAAPRVATRSTAQTHTGSYAMRLGIVEESNVSSPSAIRQRVDIPVDATYALLSFHYYPVAEVDRRNDYWELMIFEPGTNNTVATLWKNPTGNERRWLPMNIDLLAYRGRSLDLYFNLYNDGQGGASALYVDDVVFQICTPTSGQATPTTIISTAVPTPVTPYPTPSGACQELIVNGAFESGAEGWILGRTERQAGLVAEPRHSGNQAMRLGFIDGANVTTFSSIRQTVTIPHDAVSAAITFWTYPMSTATGGQDHQEFVILSPTDNSTLDLPWRVQFDNSRVWKQQRVDLMKFKGQSIVVYFNSYNDGYGGNTALIVDDISLQACRHVPPTAMPLSVSTGTGTPTITFDLATATPTTTEADSSATLAPAGAADSQTDATPDTAAEFARDTPTPEPTEPVEEEKKFDMKTTVIIVGLIIVLSTLVVILVWRGGGGGSPPQSAQDFESLSGNPPSDQGGGSAGTPSAGGTGPGPATSNPTHTASTPPKPRQSAQQARPFTEWHTASTPHGAAPDPSHTWHEPESEAETFDDVPAPPVQNDPRESRRPATPSSSRDRVVSSVKADAPFRQPPEQVADDFATEVSPVSQPEPEPPASSTQVREEEPHSPEVNDEDDLYE